MQKQPLVGMESDDQPTVSTVVVPATASTLIASTSIDQHVQEFEARLLAFLVQHGLPTDGILVPAPQRVVALRNLDAALEQLDATERAGAGYIAKAVAAVANGLFDAALNYLWDETISQLRHRVAQYDLAYFYDLVITDPAERRDYQTDDDLVHLSDSELLRGAAALDVISDLGHHQLDSIRYHRNWASAAHPNQHQLRGLQLVEWLETCIAEVIARPLPAGAASIKQLLANIKRNALTPQDARATAAFFPGLTQDQVNQLVQGFFGIYTGRDTAAQTRQNVTFLLPHLWGRVDEQTRRDLGLRPGRFAANGEHERQRVAEEFLSLVGGLAYLSDDLRAVKLQALLERLYKTHNELNNFYTEPPLARELAQLVGDLGQIPAVVERRYVLTLVLLFLTNGNGVARGADPIYRQLLGQLSRSQVLRALLAFTNATISRKLRAPLCQRQFNELLVILDPQLPAAGKQLVSAIRSFPGPLDNLADDATIKPQVSYLQTLIN